MQLTLRDGNVLEEQNNSREGEFRGQCRKQMVVKSGLFDMLEPSRNSQQNLDRVVLAPLPVTAVKPRSESEDDNDEGIAEDAEEEEKAGYRYCSGLI